MLSSSISADFYFYTGQFYCSGFIDDEIEAQKDAICPKAHSHLDSRAHLACGRETQVLIGATLNIKMS